MFNQLTRIKKTDKTSQDAIESYGSFVRLYNITKSRVLKSTRKGWSSERILLSKMNTALAELQKAIVCRWGIDTLQKATTDYPFE